MKVTDKACMVVFDDESGVIGPMGWDEDCEGALEYAYPVVIFDDRRQARQAISVSRKFASLRKEQGKIANSDFFPECSKHIHVVNVVSACQGKELEK